MLFVFVAFVFVSIIFVAIIFVAFVFVAFHLWHSICGFDREMVSK